MRKIVLAIALILFVCGIATIALGIYFIPQALALLFPSPTLTPPEITGTPATPTIPTVAATSTPPVSNSSLDALLQIDVPRDDPLNLVSRLKKTSGAFATPVTPTLYRVGDRTTFWVSREITGTNTLITATLRYMTPHVYMWLEDGQTASDSSLKSAGDTFENKIYPTDRKFFGSEATPGVDNDPHIFILNTHFTGASGYFSYSDEYPTYVNRFSNQHEMFYIDVASLQPGSEVYASVLAHEFVHMIHWNQNGREAAWILEGLGDLGIYLNNYSIGHPSLFTTDPDLQLDSFCNPCNEFGAHYGASYLFFAYCLNRFGDDFIRDVISSGTHDLFSIQKALDARAPGLKFDDVFADWVVANFINDKRFGERYFYSPEPLGIKPTNSYSRYPVTQQTDVNQYGADYIELRPAGRDVTFTFDGATTVKAVPTNAHSGKMMWWSNRVDQSDTRLTHAFDLSALSKATLKFWTWYDIEDGFDYAYVVVSTDDGKTWNTVPGRATTTNDPNGANYGNGYTCKSGAGCGTDSGAAQWIEEQMDLSPYVGKKVLVRFEYVSDAEVVRPGFVVDDISIPELNFSDDAEQSDNGWQAEGFARIDNVLPQRFIVQAIEFGSPTRVTSITLDDTNHGTFTTSQLGRGVSRVVIVVSGNTPVTWEPASYSYKIQ
jgi:hypothetical protein